MINMSSSPVGRRLLSTVVLLCAGGAGLVWVLGHREAVAPNRPVNSDAAATEHNGAATPTHAETATAPEALSTGADASTISAAEAWNFPEPDVYLQFEWYHLDRECPRLVPEPEPTPMVRQVAIRANFKPCFVCAKGDLDRPVEDLPEIPEPFEPGVSPTDGTEAAAPAAPGETDGAAASSDVPVAPSLP